MYPELAIIGTAITIAIMWFVIRTSVESAIVRAHRRIREEDHAASLDQDDM